MPARSMWRRNSCPSPTPSCASFDQAGQIGHDKRTIGAQIDQAEVRILGGERIVGDFGPGTRQAAQERALAGVRFADQSDVGDHFQFQEQIANFAFAAGRVLARRAVGRRFEVGVALAAAAAAGDDDLLAGLRQVFEQKLPSAS